MYTYWTIEVPPLHWPPPHTHTLPIHWWQYGQRNDKHLTSCLSESNAITILNHMIQYWTKLNSILWGTDSYSCRIRSGHLAAQARYTEFLGHPISSSVKFHFPSYKFQLQVANSVSSSISQVALQVPFQVPLAILDEAVHFHQVPHFNFKFQVPSSVCLMDNL